MKMQGYVSNGLCQGWILDEIYLLCTAFIYLGLNNQRILKP